MTEVMRAIKLSKLENDLLDIEFEIKKCEGIVNSINIKSQKFKDEHKKKLIKLVNQRAQLTSKITEAMFLDGDI